MPELTEHERGIARLLRPLEDFLGLEAAGGLVLMAAAAVAFAIANSPFDASYEALLALPVELRAGGASLAKPLLLWINDGFMAVFFLLVGLELKREVVEGHLASVRSAALPACAALGGMAVPAAIYVALNWGDPAALRGWAIPAATDIAFALGVLTLLGNAVPPALKAFLLSVAIFDDLGAILVIALFYSTGLSPAALIVAALLVAGLALLNRAGVTRIAAYMLLGVPLWVAILKSGVHATLAGVIVAVFIPIRATPTLGDSPLHRLEHQLHPWVAFGVLPIFAFANAGVSLRGLDAANLLHAVPLGIFAGLVAGKQVGVMLSSWVAVRTGLASLGSLRWAELYGAALLCGIGFTMSLFIASLALEQGDVAYFGLERLGILAGSIASGVLGYTVLRASLKRPRDSSAG